MRCTPQRPRLLLTARLGSVQATLVCLGGVYVSLLNALAGTWVAEAHVNAFSPLAAWPARSMPATG